MDFRRAYLILLIFGSFNLLFCNKNSVLASEYTSDYASSSSTTEALLDSESTSDFSEDYEEQSQEQGEFISIWSGNVASSGYTIESLYRLYPGIHDSRNYDEIAETLNGREALRKYIKLSSKRSNKLAALCVLYPGITRKYNYEEMAKTREDREALLLFADSSLSRKHALKALEALFPQIDDSSTYIDMTKTLEGLEALRIYINVTNNYQNQIDAFNTLIIAEQNREREHNLSTRGSLYVASGVENTQCVIPYKSILETEDKIKVENQFRSLAKTLKGTQALISIARLSESVEIKLSIVKILIPGISSDFNEEKLIDYKTIAKTPIGAEALCIYLTLENRPGYKLILLKIVDALFSELKDVAQYLRLVNLESNPPILIPSICKSVLNVYNTMKNEISSFGKLCSITESDEIYFAYKFCKAFFKSK